MTDNQQEQKPKVEGTDDIFVSIGDLRGYKLADVKVDAGYEAMVEDYIGNFNHIVVQGMSPVTALMAFAQAFALALGYCLRAGLQPSDGRKLLGMLITESNNASKQVAITTQKVN